MCENESGVPGDRVPLDFITRSVSVRKPEFSCQHVTRGEREGRAETGHGEREMGLG